MARLGVQHAVDELAAHHHARAHAGADGEVEHVLEAARTTERDLAQAGDVDVGIVAHGDIEARLERAEQVEVAPSELGRGEDLTKARGRRVNRRRAERAHAERRDAAVGEPLRALAHRLLGRRGVKPPALHNRAVRVARGEHHLGTARLERAQKNLLRHCLSPHRSTKRKIAARIAQGPPAHTDGPVTDFI